MLFCITIRHLHIFTLFDIQYIKLNESGGFKLPNLYQQLAPAPLLNSAARKRCESANCVTFTHKRCRISFEAQQKKVFNKVRLQGHILIWLDFSRLLRQMGIVCLTRWPAGWGWSSAASRPSLSSLCCSSWYTDSVREDVNASKRWLEETVSKVLQHWDPKFTPVVTF